MAPRRSSRNNRRKSGRRQRPGFEKPNQGGGFPWYILIGLGGFLVLALLVWGIISLVNGPPSQGAETLTPTPTVVAPTVSPTDTPTPLPTSTPELRACTVERDTRIYREPDATAAVINQDLSAGRTVRIVEQVTVDDVAWYEVLLPGDDVPWYVSVDVVVCE